MCVREQPLPRGRISVSCRNGENPNLSRARKQAVFLAALSVLSLIGAAAAPPDAGLEWGPVSSGLRLGIGFGPVSPQPTLRIVFENATAGEVQIPLGGSTAKGPLYNLVFRVKPPAGEEIPLFDFSGPRGLHLKVDPLVARLARGQKYEILLPLDKLAAFDHGRNRPLSELLSEHYAVRAVLDTTGDPREVHTFAIWAGTVSSGELGAAR
jgi:hypothetical protein